MKKKLCLLIIVICTIISSIFIINNTINYNKNDALVRTVNLEKNQINVESYFKNFDSYDLVCDGRTLTFNGYSTLDLNDLLDLDLVSETDTVPCVVTKYICDYDMKNSIVSLSLAIVNGDDIEIVDKIYGVLVLNDNMEFDVSFDVDGEILLLSELQNVELIENCGFFKNLVTKVKDAVVSTVTNVVETTKKVCSTNAGKIGTIATVAACAVAGVVCAVIPGCQVGTAIFVGMAIGYIGASTTAAISTYQQDGEVDWDAVQTYGQCGAIVGGAVSGLAYGITTGISNVIASGAQNATTEAAKSTYCSGSNCFIEGTLIFTNNGYKEIEDVIIGDYILSYNENTNSTEYKEVTVLYRNVTDTWIHLYIDNEEIVCTPGHLFYSIDKGWVTALELKINDDIIDNDYNVISIDNKYIEYLENTEITYNFEVEDNHTYYVGENKILTHNVCQKMSSSSLPDNAKDAYNAYSKNGWKGNVSGQAQGTHAGGTWRNDFSQLPTQDVNGNPITYKKFDINSPGNTGRDAYRFIHGSDGKTYYTTDHYLEFIEIIEEIFK